MLSTEFLDGEVGLERPLAQFGNAIGQPVARPPRCLIFGIQLVHQIGCGDRVDDLRCKDRRRRIIGEFQRIGPADTLDAETLQQPVRKTPFQGSVIHYRLFCRRREPLRYVDK